MSVSAGRSALSAGEAITVLHVDDDPDVLELTATFLERTDRRFEVVTETDPEEALDGLDGGIDCVVSDYQMPAMDGLAFLEAVRELVPELPFILFTGKGSEEIASDAISAGVTDYLQKRTGTDQYDILANRIANAVDSHRTAREHAQVHAALETATEGIAILDEQGRYVYANEAYAGLYGLSREELVGDHWETIYPEDQVERFHGEILPALEAEGEWSGKSSGLRADGSTFVEQLSLTDLSDGGHVCVVRDITDRVERERELQRERDRASALFENMTEPIAYYEFQGEYPIVRDLNPVFEETFGADAAEVTGRSLDDIMVPPEHADEGERINERVRAGEVVDREVIRQTADGLRTFNLLSVPLRPGESGERGFTVYTDISARKAYERELEQYRTLVETVGDPMYMLDADGAITMVNDAIVEQWGYPRDELLEMHASDVIPEKDYERGTQVIRELLADEDQSWGTFEMRSITTDGETLVNENKIGVIVEDGEYVGSVGVLRDITRRKERERELERKNEHLEEFTSVVSHDLRNPLNVAASYTELAAEECDTPYLGRVADAHERMETLIDDLLTLAREGETVAEFEPVEIGSLLSGCWEVLGREEATLAVETDATVRADRDRLRQLVENLLSNAVEHGDTDVTVTVGDCEDGFYVADDGPGIPDEGDDVFEAGYSTSQEGTGFGLSIVARIADAHGWDVAVTDGEDGGARFEITGVETVE